MERKFCTNTTRAVENLVFSKISVSRLLSTLEPVEFDVLWDSTDISLTDKQIAQQNGLSESQVKTIKFAVARKAQAYLT